MTSLLLFHIYQHFLLANIQELTWDSYYKYKILTQISRRFFHTKLYMIQSTVPLDFQMIINKANIRTHSNIEPLSIRINSSIYPPIDPRKKHMPITQYNTTHKYYFIFNLIYSIEVCDCGLYCVCVHTSGHAVLIIKMLFVMIRQI